MPPMKPDALAKNYFAGTSSVANLSRRWCLSEKEIRRMLAAQELAFTQICGRIRIAESDIERYEQEHRR